MPFSCPEASSQSIFAIDRPPQIVTFAIDPHENLFEMTTTLPPGSQPFGAVLDDLASEHRAGMVRPETNRFVADVDAALVKPILDDAKRQWKVDLIYHG